MQNAGEEVLLLDTPHEVQEPIKEPLDILRKSHKKNLSTITESQPKSDAPTLTSLGPGVTAHTLSSALKKQPKVIVTHKKVPGSITAQDLNGTQIKNSVLVMMPQHPINFSKLQL